ncbi:MAG: radical SAM protein [Lachnospiraceae bacterium]|nr:radical SAM protein [Lachnospiraceae bacterium]
METKSEKILYPIAEIFESVNGEGPNVGKLAVFVRFAGCNLACSFCDTMWANEPDCPVTWMDADEIHERVRRTGTRLVTVTGGEPLMVTGLVPLLNLFTEPYAGSRIPSGIGFRESNADNGTIYKPEYAGSEFHPYRGPLSVEIETNGSIPIDFLDHLPIRPTVTMDYKLPGSGMEDHMRIENFHFLKPTDTVKFVAGSVEDLDRAREIIQKYHLTSICQVYIGPVFGRIKPVRIAEYMMEHAMNDVTLQLQLHKILWDPERRGV